METQTIKVSLPLYGPLQNEYTSQEHVKVLNFTVTFFKSMKKYLI